MFRASSAHLQEDTVVHVQHMVLSLSMRVLGGLSVHSLSEIDITIKVQRSKWKVAVINFRFYWNLNFPDRFLENAQISNFMKILPVGAELLHADRQTDRHGEVNFRFSQILRKALKTCMFVNDRFGSSGNMFHRFLFRMCPVRFLAETRTVLTKSTFLGSSLLVSPG